MMDQRFKRRSEIFDKLLIISCSAAGSNLSNIYWKMIMLSKVILKKTRLMNMLLAIGKLPIKNPTEESIQTKP